MPVDEVVGLDAPRETVETEEIREGVEMDLVTHDVKKFMQMMLKRNGYVLEQLHSPLIVHTTPEHAELKELARGCVTRHHRHHYLGFAANQWQLFEKENPRRAKPLLYVFRVLLTGIHLMRTGEVEANLLSLNDEFKLSYVPDLIARKLAEQSTLPEQDFGFYEGEFRRLMRQLEEIESGLREEPSTRRELNDLLIRVRRMNMSPL